MNLSQEIESLRSMTVRQLKRKYKEVFGKECRTFHKEFLWKRIAWRMQVLTEGDIGEHFRRHAMEMACDADIRIQAPKGGLHPLTRKSALTSMHPSGDPRIPMGGELRRIFRGRLIVARVEENGFRYEDKLYKSISAVARAATGINWNGFDFFRITNKDRKKKETGR